MEYYLSANNYLPIVDFFHMDRLFSSEIANDIFEHPNSKR